MTAASYHVEKMSQAVLGPVAAALAQGPGTAREVWQRVGCWAPQTVQNALEVMVAEGTATVTREPIPTGYRKRYAPAR